MIAYFADIRQFSIRDKVKKNKSYSYQSSLNHSGLAFEKDIESMRPHYKQSRNDGFYVFKELKDAMKYWSKKKNFKLYKIEIADSDIDHIGDMNIIELAYENTLYRTSYIDNYWKGLMSDEPIIEILLDKKSHVKIIDIICDDDSLREAFGHKRRNPKSDLKRMGFENVDDLYKLYNS